MNPETQIRPIFNLDDNASWSTLPDPDTPMAEQQEDPQDVVICNLQAQLECMEERFNTLPAAQANPEPQRIVYLKPDHPPPFTSKKGESLEAWIFQMEQYCKL